MSIPTPLKYYMGAIYNWFSAAVSSILIWGGELSTFSGILEGKEIAIHMYVCVNLCVCIKTYLTYN